MDTAETESDDTPCQPLQLTHAHLHSDRSSDSCESKAETQLLSELRRCCGGRQDWHLQHPGVSTVRGEGHLVTARRGWGGGGGRAYRKGG